MLTPLPINFSYRPARPLYLDDAYSVRNEPWTHNDAGARADKSKKALLSAASKVTHLTAHIGTEIEGLQLKDLTDQQRDELALLIAERSVVFFRDQDLSPRGLGRPGLPRPSIQAGAAPAAPGPAAQPAASPEPTVEWIEPPTMSESPLRHGK